jgi:hypothetical protein
MSSVDGIYDGVSRGSNTLLKTGRYSEGEYRPARQTPENGRFKLIDHPESGGLKRA